MRSLKRSDTIRDDCASITQTYRNQFGRGPSIWQIKVRMDERRIALKPTNNRPLIVVLHRRLAEPRR
jgi:hypothetical protein